MAENLKISDIPDMMCGKINGRTMEYFLVTPAEYWRLRYMAMAHESVNSHQMVVESNCVYVDGNLATKLFNVPNAIINEAYRQGKVGSRNDGEYFLYNANDIRRLFP